MGRIRTTVKFKFFTLAAAIILTFSAAIGWLYFQEKKNLYEDRRQMVKNQVETAWSVLDHFGNKVQNQELSLEDAQQQAMQTIKKMRYGDSGYFWINDTGKPIPKMIMHPTVPALDGTVLDDPKYNCALGVKENLFVAFRNVTERDGEGFVDYLWPKPTKKGLTEDQVCFIGDDLPDLLLLKKVGLSVTVVDAVDEVKERVDLVTNNKGGHGAVREVCEFILRAQKKWAEVVLSFDK